MGPTEPMELNLQRPPSVTVHGGPAGGGAEASCGGGELTLLTAVVPTVRGGAPTGGTRGAG